MKRSIVVCMLVVLVVSAMMPLAQSQAAPRPQAAACNFENIVSEVGEITHVSADNPPTMVMVEEVHNSILGQLQSATMFVRLTAIAG